MQDFSNKITGSSYTASEFNQAHVELENLITSTGITLSASDLEQLGKSVANYAGGADFYTDSGAANAYVLSVVGSKKGPTILFDGLRARFRPGNTNTGASTVNVNGLTAVAVKTLSNAALVGGEIVASDLVEMIYLSALSAFVIMKTYNNRNSIVTKSSSYVITDNDNYRVILVSGSGTTITLPTPGDNIGRLITIKNIDTTNVITIARDNANDTIDGIAQNYLMSTYLESITVLFNSANTCYLL